MQPILKNTGVILEDLTPSDLVFGSNDRVKHDIVLSDYDWLKYYSAGELQHGIYYDTMGCVSFHALDIVEAILNYKLRHKLLDIGNVKWLQENGYIDEKGEVNLSDRFTTAMSGTSELGNSGGRVWWSIRNHGTVPEKLCAWDKGRNVEYDKRFGSWFRNPDNVSQKAKDLGKEFKKRFDIFYEVISTDLESLKGGLVRSPVELFIPTRCEYKDTIQQYCDGRIGHAVSLCDDLEPRKYLPLFDSYIKQPQEEGNERFIRRVVENYKRHQSGYVCTIIEKRTELHREPFSLIKQHDIPDIYFYGLDKEWHGFGSMDILRTFKGQYKKEDVEYVNVLPSNISFTLSKKV